LTFFVVTEDHCIEVLGGKRVTADHKFLSFIKAHLAPGAGTSAWLILALQVFCNNTFQTLRSHGLNHLREAGVQFRALADRILHSCQDVPAEQVATFGQRLSYQILSRKHQHIEHVIEDWYIRCSIVLQCVERGPSRSIESHDLTINDCLIWQSPESRCHG